MASACAPRAVSACGRFPGSKGVRENPEAAGLVRQDWTVEPPGLAWLIVADRYGQAGLAVRVANQLLRAGVTGAVRFPVRVGFGRQTGSSMRVAMHHDWIAGIVAFSFIVVPWSRHAQVGTRPCRVRSLKYDQLRA
jgi:hypothetical protein